MSTISGPYRVTEDDIERSSTLDAIDFDEVFLLINGAMVFFETERRAHEMKNALEADNRGQ